MNKYDRSLYAMQWDPNEDIEEEPYIKERSLAEKRKRDWLAAKRRARKTSFLEEDESRPLHYYAKNGLRNNSDKSLKRSERDRRQFENYEDQLEEILDSE